MLESSVRASIPSAPDRSRLSLELDWASPVTHTKHLSRKRYGTFARQRNFRFVEGSQERWCIVSALIRSDTSTWSLDQHDNAFVKCKSYWPSLFFCTKLGSSLTPERSMKLNDALFLIKGKIFVEMPSLCCSKKCEDCTCISLG